MKENEELDLLELAWGLIANKGGGDWDRESEEWREAATRWRDKYHAVLRRHLAPTITGAGPL